MEDVFIEKIVPQKKRGIDYLKMLGIVIAYFALNFVILIIPFLFFLLPLGILGGAYLVYLLFVRLNLEHEYIVTNGTLDVDRIYGKRTRKRVFSADARDMEVCAEVGSDSYKQYVKRGDYKTLDASARTEGEKNVWFCAATYKGQKWLLLFEADARILESLYRRNPSKVEYRPYGSALS